MSKLQSVLNAVQNLLNLLQPQPQHRNLRGDSFKLEAFSCAQSLTAVNAAVAGGIGVSVGANIDYIAAQFLSAEELIS